MLRSIFPVGVLTTLLSVTSAHASGMPGTSPCTFLGNWCVPTNVIYNAIPYLADFLVAVAAGASVLFVIVGGGLMLISAGEEGQITKGKMSIIYALVGLGITMISQTFVIFLNVRFGGLHGHEQPVFAFMSFAVSAMVYIFNAVFVLMMVFAGFRMAFARGSSEEFAKARNMLVWAIIGAVVVNIAYALVNAVWYLPI